MIVGHRTIKGRRQFLVRWKGYSSSSDSWENEKDLNCPQLIEDFLANEKDKEIKPMKAKAAKNDKTDKLKKARSTSKKEMENGTLSLNTLHLYDNMCYTCYVFSRR